MKQTNHKITILLLIIISSSSYAVKGEEGQQKPTLLKRLHKQSIDKKNLTLQLPHHLSKEIKNELQELLDSLKFQSIESKKIIPKILKLQVSEKLEQLPDELQEETKKSFINILESPKTEEIHPVKNFKKYTLEQLILISLYKKNPLAEITDPRLFTIFSTLDESTKKELSAYRNKKIFKKN